MIYMFGFTVEAIAAGTFAMMDITPLRSRSMKIWRNPHLNLTRQDTAENSNRCKQIGKETMKKAKSINIHNQSKFSKRTTHAMIKKIRPSPKIRVTSLERVFAGNNNFHPVIQRTIKSKTME
jgi:hypothetical protein